MKVLITSGGTTEKIDNVRSISNTSTGKLGNLIAMAFAALPNVDKIYYLCSKTAVLPQSEKVNNLYVDSVLSLERGIQSIFDRESIDIIVHCMAVSDYRVKSVTSASNLTKSMISQQYKLNDLTDKNGTAMVLELLGNAESIIGGNGKISSDIDDMLLLMERTPKIISSFQNLSPNSIVVGFKLLDNVSHETLIDTAYGLLVKNKCHFVLANDLQEINENGHVGYLIDKDKNYNRFTTKEEIAAAIVSATMNVKGEPA